MKNDGLLQHENAIFTAGPSNQFQSGIVAPLKVGEHEVRTIKVDNDKERTKEATIRRVIR